MKRVLDIEDSVPFEEYRQLNELKPMKNGTLSRISDDVGILECKKKLVYDDLPSDCCEDIWEDDGDDGQQPQPLVYTAGDHYFLRSGIGWGLVMRGNKDWQSFVEVIPNLEE